MPPRIIPADALGHYGDPNDGTIQEAVRKAEAEREAYLKDPHADAKAIARAAAREADFQKWNNQPRRRR